MVVILCTPLSIPRSLFNKPSSSLTPRNATNKSTVAAAERQRRRSRSPLETRIALVLSLAAQSSSLSQRVLGDFATETAKYLLPRRFQARNLEEAFMSVPNLETVKFRVLKREDQYEIRDVEPYFIAETTMPGKTGFDFSGSSQGFNVLAAYLFGENIASEQMEMTTPVFTRKVQPNGEKMSMTTPVITKRSGNQDKWQMSFVMPSKYGSNLPIPKDSSVSIREVPRRILAVNAFSGFVTDEDVKHRESRLRRALKTDAQFQVKEEALVEVAQFNPPFTLPFTRRNEIALEVERKTI